MTVITTKKASLPPDSLPDKDKDKSAHSGSCQTFKTFVKSDIRDSFSPSAVLFSPTDTNKIIYFTLNETRKVTKYAYVQWYFPPSLPLSDPCGKTEPDVWANMWTFLRSLISRESRIRIYTEPTTRAHGRWLASLTRASLHRGVEWGGQVSPCWFSELKKTTDQVIGVTGLIYRQPHRHKSHKDYKVSETSELESV